MLKATYLIIGILFGSLLLSSMVSASGGEIGVCFYDGGGNPVCKGVNDPCCTGLTNFTMDISLSNNSFYNQTKPNLSIQLNTKIKQLSYIDYTDRVPKKVVLCTDCQSYESKKIFKEGLQKLTFIGENWIGTSKYAWSTQEINITFVIDTKDPKISKILPASNKFTNGSGFIVKYTEENLKNIVLFCEGKNSVKEDCPSGKNSICSLDLDLSEFEGRLITCNFTIEDFAGHKTSSRPIKVNVDTLPPEINFFNYSVKGKYLLLNLTLNETNLGELIYPHYSNSRLIWRDLCSNVKDGNCFKKLYFSKTGQYNLTIRALDKAGNSAEQSIVFDII